MAICSDCGALVPDNVMYCTDCGKTMTNTAAIPVTADVLGNEPLGEPLGTADGQTNPLPQNTIYSSPTPQQQQQYAAYSSPPPQQQQYAAYSSPPPPPPQPPLYSNYTQTPPQPSYSWDNDSPPPPGSPYAVMSVGSYIGHSILFSLPLVGWIICLVMAFSSKNKNKKNYARSLLIMILIGIVLSVVMSILFYVFFKEVFMEIIESSIDSYGIYY